MKILIVVDMQKDFISGPLGTAEARAIVPYVVEKAKNTPRENPVSYTHLTLPTKLEV